MKTIDRITTYVAAFGVLLSVASFFVSIEVGVGALAGAVIAVADWLATRFVAARLLAAADGGRTMLSLTLVGKMTLVLAACALVLSTGAVHPLGFLIGVSAMVAGVLVGGLQGASVATPQPSESK